MSTNITPRRARLPKDAFVQIQTYPLELHVNVTITKPEHLQALYETLATFAPMLLRDQDDD